MAGKIKIDSERCKGCGLCVPVCPKAVIAMSEESNHKGYFPARVVNDECIACCACALVCPDCAIEVYRDDDAEPVASGREDRADLVKELR